MISVTDSESVVKNQCRKESVEYKINIVQSQFSIEAVFSESGSTVQYHVTWVSSGWILYVIVWQESTLAEYRMARVCLGQILYGKSLVGVNAQLASSWKRRPRHTNITLCSGRIVMKTGRVILKGIYCDWGWCTSVHLCQMQRFSKKHLLQQAMLQIIHIVMIFYEYILWIWEFLRMPIILAGIVIELKSKHLKGRCKGTCPSVWRTLFT